MSSPLSNGAEEDSHHFIIAKAVKQILDPELNEIHLLMKYIFGEKWFRVMGLYYAVYGKICPPIVQNGDFAEYDFKLGTQIVTEKHGIRITYNDTNGNAL